MPESWLPIIDRRLTFVETLPETERTRFFEHLKVFVWEKHFFGVKGLEVTDEIRIVVAAAAARISRRLSLDVYDRLTEIVIYPSTYQHGPHAGGVLGEAHPFGTVVLAWDAVTGGIATPNDGHDTAIHEFAHVLDIADGVFDGTPELDADAFDDWGHVMGKHFERLKADHARSPLREYGATNEAEFFAVATEAFFEKPKTLERRAPDLYRELRRFFRVDPARQPRPRPGKPGPE